MPPLNRGQFSLAPWVFAFATLAPVSSAWAQASAPADQQVPAAAQPVGEQPQASGQAQAEAAAGAAAGLDYASQAALKVDAYLDKVIQALQSASREGPAGFDLRVPQITGPAGKPAALVYTERLTDRLVNHPRDAGFLTRDDIAAAMRGRQVQLRDGLLVITSVNPGGASAIGVAIPAAELVERLPDASAPGGILLFDLSGHPLAVRGELSADQLGVFELYLPQRPPSLVVTETPYSVAASGRADLLVVTRMLGGGLAPEAPLPDNLFANPTLVRKAIADPKADLLSKVAIAAPIGVGILGGLIIFLFRRARARSQGDKGRNGKSGMPDLPDLDYLDALAEGRPAAGKGSGNLEMAIEGEDAVITAYDRPRDFVEGVGEVRVLKKLADDAPAAETAKPITAARPEHRYEAAPATMPETTPEATPDTLAEAPFASAVKSAVESSGQSAGQPAVELVLEAPEAAADDTADDAAADAADDTADDAAADAADDTADDTADDAADGAADDIADDAAETAAHDAPEEPARAAADGADEAAPAEVDKILADLIESTTQEVAADTIQAEQDARDRAEQAAQESAEIRGRASRLKDRLAERLDFFKTAVKGSDAAEPPAPAAAAAPPPSLSPPPRDVIHIGRSGVIDDPPDFRRKQKTVNPGDVLITKGEAQGLVEKESDKLLNRMQGLMREVEIRTAEALSVHRETFRELLEQFEALQENRDRDLASMHDLKNQLANDVTGATLKLKQAEAKATEGMLRLKEQMDNLTRKLEGWAVDARISEERLTGALETIRDGWENQMEAHAELRKEVMRLTESMQDLSRKQEASTDRESAERRAAVDQLAFEIKTVQLSAENDFSVMASRIDELKSGISTLAQRLDRTEGHQAQAIEAVYRKIDAGEALEAVRQRFGRELDGLKGQLYQEMEEAMATSARGNIAYQEQIDAIMAENSRLSQRQHQMVQLMANLHSALGKSDARAAEEVERLKAQNAEMQQVMLSMMRSGQRPPAQPGQAPHPGQGQPPRRHAPPGGPLPQPAMPGQPHSPQGQPTPGHTAAGPQGAGHPGQPAQPPAQHASGHAPHAAPTAGHDPSAGAPAAQLPDIPARPPAHPEHRGHAEADEAAHEPRPIDLWSRLLGRERQPADDQPSQRKRRSK